MKGVSDWKVMILVGSALFRSIKILSSDILLLLNTGMETAEAKIICFKEKLRWDNIFYPSVTGYQITLEE